MDNWALVTQKEESKYLPADQVLRERLPSRNPKTIMNDQLIKTSFVSKTPNQYGRTKQKKSETKYFGRNTKRTLEKVVVVLMNWSKAAPRNTGIFLHDWSQKQSTCSSVACIKTYSLTVRVHVSKRWYAPFPPQKRSHDRENKSLSATLIRFRRYLPEIRAIFLVSALTLFRWPGTVCSDWPGTAAGQYPKWSKSPAPKVRRWRTQVDHLSPFRRLSEQ